MEVIVVRWTRCYGLYYRSLNPGHIELTMGGLGFLQHSEQSHDQFDIVVMVCIPGMLAPILMFHSF